MKMLGSVLGNIGVLVAAFGGWQVWIDKGGKISPQEATPIFIGGVALFVVGLVIQTVANKKLEAKDQP